MQLGIIADTHDNLDKVRQAVALFNRIGINQLIHCGDIVAPFVLKEFGQLRSPLVLIYGNCDGDRNALAEVANKLGFRIQLSPLSLQFGSKTVVVTHEPTDDLPDCDFYIHGHTHRVRYEPGKPVIINPGEACGWLTGRSTAAVLDIEKTKVEFFDL
ncbi:MAG: metallophosphoesterase [candidate division WOR-3 bacterium]